MTLIFLLFPPALMTNLFHIHNALIVELLKITIFALAATWIVRHVSGIRFNIGLLIIILLISLELMTVTTSYGRSMSDMLYAVLYLAPLYLLLTRTHTPYIPSPLITYAYLAVLGLSVVFVMINPSVEVGRKLVYPILISGPHTSSYSLMLLFLFFFYCFRLELVSRRQLIAVGVIILILLMGYKARNAIFGMLLFTTSYLFFISRFSTKLQNLILFFGAVIAGSMLMIILDGFSLDWNTMSSGRLASWGERIDILQGYDMATFLFGQGYGADLMKTTQWWWSEKASHNDFLSMLFNGGFILFMLMNLFLLKLYGRADPFQKAMLVFLVVTSITNTGLLGRPIQFLFFCLIFMLAGYPRHKGTA